MMALSVLLLVASVSVEANVRLPIRCELPPSSALFSPSRDLTVLHEDLQFDCDSGGCQVSATYLIRSKQQAVIKLSFISPSNRVETVTINGSDAKPGEVLVARYTDFSQLYESAKANYKYLADLQQKRNDAKSTATQRSDVDADPEYINLSERLEVAKRELERLNPMRDRNNLYVELFGKLTKLVESHEEDCHLPPDLSQSQGWEHYLACLAMGNSPTSSEYLFDTKQIWELYQFAFDAAIIPGENTVQVRYHQPYSFAEPWVRYFSSPPSLRYVSYELWPLKEWNLAPEFKIDLTVRFHNPRYGFLYRKRDSVLVSVAQFKERRFGALFRQSANLSPNTSEQLDNHLVYKTSLHVPVSDRLIIITSEQDTLDEVRGGINK